MPALACVRPVPSDSPGHAWFEHHLPELTSRAKALFSRLPYNDREDAVAEVLAFIFQYALRAFQRGVLNRLTPYTMVVFCGKNYASGRRFAGSSSLCPLSKQTQMERGVSVHSVEECRQEWDPANHKYLAQRLADTLPANRNRDRPFENGRRVVDYSDILDRENLSLKARRVFDFLLETNSDGQLIDLCQELRVADTLAVDRNHDRPLENVRQRRDYPDILDREEVSPKALRVFDYLLETNAGGQLIDLCQELRVTPGRISQLKGELADALARHGYTPGRSRTCDLANRKRRGRRPGWRAAKSIPMNVSTNPVPVPA